MGGHDERFIVDFEAELISDLHRRLDSVRWPEHGFDAGWRMGMDQAILRDLVGYWRHQFDWSSICEELNALEHRVVDLAGERLHYVMYRAGPSDAPAILALHGWPGSFVEFMDAAPLLRDAGYQVIVPSLPGFALSDPPRRPGLHGGLIADRLHQLMQHLGYDRYGVQGGDWGSVIALAMANRWPDSVAGVHVNLIPGSPQPPQDVEPDEEESSWRAWRDGFNRSELAYYDLQATKPDVLAYGLTDSPVGLLAWILEKFWAWGGHGGDLWSVFDRDRVLANVMLYWLPNRVQSSARIYYEMENAVAPIIGGWVETPTGYLRTPAEPWGPPRVVAERVANIVHYTESPVGGHFAAMEQPRAWATDVEGFFAQFWKD